MPAISVKTHIYLLSNKEFEELMSLDICSLEVIVWKILIREAWFYSHFYVKGVKGLNWEEPCDVTWVFIKMENSTSGIIDLYLKIF